MLGHKSLTTTLNIYTKYIRKDEAIKTTFLDEINFSFAQKLHTS